jgi:uncharacterized membrane protein
MSWAFFLVADRATDYAVNLQDEIKENERRRIARETSIVAGCVMAIVSVVGFCVGFVWLVFANWKT